MSILKDRTIIGVAGLAASTLLLESSLIRLLSVAQFYHFAFLVVSLALLGFGASGTLLNLSTRLQKAAPKTILPLIGVGFFSTVGAAYAIINLLPFDSFSIAWDRRQVYLFALYFFAMALPFLFSGLGIGVGLAGSKGRSHLIYAANLVGSAAGALLGPLLMNVAGILGAVLASGLLGLTSTAIFKRPRFVGLIATIGIVLIGIGWSVNSEGNAPLGMTISPYKGLSYALQYPGSERRFGSSSAVSRVDVIAGAGIRQLPGLSYAYPGTPPQQLGLSVDAGDVQPISLITPNDFSAAAYMPEAVAWQLRSSATALILNPGGGLSLLQTLAGGISQVTAVVDDPLIRRAVAMTSSDFDIYDHPQVQFVSASGRGFLSSSDGEYDFVFLPLTDGFRPVSSGAYSLTENYLLTIEAIRAMLQKLKPNGIFLATRWLQLPPSESLRLITTVAAALEEVSIANPADLIVAYRGVQTVTIFVQLEGWSHDELEQIRAFTMARKYDLVWLPGLLEEETNRFNKLPEPVVFESVRDFLNAPDRETFYKAYPFAISPPLDDRPFFFHFFTWSQAPEVLATVGRVWQPFGGSGYFVLLALLALVLMLSVILIISPLLIRKENSQKPVSGFSRITPLTYFGLLGVAFLFIEIPLIQRLIVLFDHPTYAFTVVVVSILTFSSLGSRFARAPWLPSRLAFGFLVIFSVITPFVVSGLIDTILGWPPLLRAIFTGVILSPLAILMGLPFPMGLHWLERNAPAFIPWAWAINGCASVISAVLAAILALSFGFSAVLWLGAGAYGLAWLIFIRFIHFQPV